MILFDFLSETIKFNLGWTLIHSLWQGALILMLIKFLHRIISAASSSQKYILNCCALFLVLLSSAGTYYYLNSSSETTLLQLPFTTSFQSSLSNNQLDTQSPLWQVLTNSINSKMPWIIGGWSIGVLIFSLRFLSGLIYIQYLKSKINEVSELWNSKVKVLCAQLGINQIVVLAESAHIKTPMVLGYAKPMILFPLGILMSLPPDQVEAILLHELSHIKRHDYLVNIAQSFIEIILFFNPFVWILSTMIREERENCCDDYVLSAGSSRIGYVKALANLGAASLKQPPQIALTLNKNKYQVFNRIKRIMETSVNNQQGKIRPFALLAIVVTALICASWLTINPKNETDKSRLTEQPANNFIQPDTVIKKNNSKEKGEEKRESTASYSRQTITTYDADGTPHEEVIEKFEGDEDLRPLFSDSSNRYSFHLQSVPAIPAIPSLPSAPSIPAIPAIPFDQSFYYSFDGDTIPGNHFFSKEDAERWEEFGRKMEERFEHFGNDQEDFARNWEEWGRQFENMFSPEFGDRLEMQMEKLQEKLQDLENNKEFKDKLNRGLKEMEQQLEKLEQTLKEHKSEFRQFEKSMEQYESELHEQLVKDGYLKKGEKVNSMNWGDGQLIVNGVKIKDKDISKYEALNKKYLKGKRGYYVPD